MRIVFILICILTDSMIISPTKSLDFQNIVEVFATTIMAQWMKVILHYSIDTFTCQIEEWKFREFFKIDGISDFRNYE